MSDTRSATIAVARSPRQKANTLLSRKGGCALHISENDDERWSWSREPTGSRTPRLVYDLVYSRNHRDAMNEAIGSYEAKTRLPELLRRVKSGRSFTITNRGEAVADLVPSTGGRKKDRVDAATRLREFMLADPIRGVEIKSLIEEGRA